MRKLETEEIKNIEVELLRAIDKYCDEHGLRYFLSSGTLLGAVRHRGFIPWDDDIDIIMPRDDYEVFVSSFNGENLVVAAQGQYERYPFAYAKVYATNTELVEFKHSNCTQGVFVDVFPLDNLGSDISKINELADLLQKKNKMLIASSVTWNKKWGVGKNLGALILKAFSCMKSTIVRAAEINSLARSLEEADNAYCGVIITAKRPYPVRIFASYTLLEFEGYNFRAPIGYEEYLTMFYGDYMQLPPEDQRVTHHFFDAYIK